MGLNTDQKNVNASLATVQADPLASSAFVQAVIIDLQGIASAIQARIAIVQGWLTTFQGWQGTSTAPGPATTDGWGATALTAVAKLITDTQAILS